MGGEADAHFHARFKFGEGSKISKESSGEVSIYHALSFGWILDGLMRRVDEKGRTVGEFLKEEIVDKQGKKGKKIASAGN